MGRSRLKQTADAQRRLLFIHNGPTRFVNLDLQLLRESYSVTEWYVRSRCVNLLKALRLVSSHHVVFGWFASWHTYLPFLFARLLRKPSLLVIGGYDLADLPDIGYGHQRGGSRKWVSRWTIRLSSRLITNSHYSRDEAERNARIPKEKVEVVYHGVPDPFGSLPPGPRAPMALSVGNVDRANLWRKGHEPFVRAAALLPKVQFVLVGAWQDDAVEHLRGFASANVTFTGWVDEETLHQYYRRASVYVQASLHEGFGLSVAEAMLAGCIPAVTMRGALPEVVGDCGVWLDSNEPSDIADGVMKALAMAPEARAHARERVLKCFSIADRRRKLERLVGRPWRG